MHQGELGRLYKDGEVIMHQGDVGDCMYVIQQGSVQVFIQKDGREIPVTRLECGDAFGEIALFQRAARTATIRAVGEVRVLTVDKRTFLRRVHEDPSIAFGLVQRMARRIVELSAELVEARQRIP